MAKISVKPKTIFLCIGLFFVFLLFSFPYRNLRGYIFGKLYKSTHILIVSEDMFPTILGWPGMVLSNVNITLPLSQSDLNISAEKVILKTRLAGLLPPLPAVSLNVKRLKGDGNLYLKVGQGSGRTIAMVEAENVDLSHLKFSALPEPLNGKLNTDADLTIDDTDISKSAGEVTLKIENFKTPTISVPMGPNYSFLIPAMKLGPAEGKIIVKDGVVSFPSMKFGAADSDLSGSLGGTIKLGKDFMGSTIGLTLRLRLSESYRTNPQAATFVSFLSTYRLSTPGDYGMRCNAQVIDIATKFACAIPEKLPE